MSDILYPGMRRYARNDPFGPTGHNNLLQRQDFLYDFFGVEHDPATGEHNTPHVARTLGLVRWSGAGGGAGSYSLEGFNGDVTLSNPTAGTVMLTLASGRGYSAQFGIVEVQCADPNGIGYPVIAHGAFLDDTHVQIVLRSAPTLTGFTSGLDGSFFISIRSPHIPNSVTRPDAPNRRKRGDGLSVAEYANDWNPFIQQMGTNRAAVLAGHISDGNHDAHEVAKVCASVRWDGTQYVVDSHRGLGAGMSRIGTGHVRLFLSDSRPAMVAPVQAFVTPSSAATGDPESTGLTHVHGIRTAMVPRDLCGAGSVDVYIYESSMIGGAPDSYAWAAADGSFSVRVHGA